MNEKMDKKTKLAQKREDMIGNLHNGIVEVFMKYKPTPEIALYILEMAKFEVLMEVYKRKFTQPLSNKPPQPFKGKK